MAKTTTMRLIELMVLKEDIHAVLSYLGRLGEFQFQQDFSKDMASSSESSSSMSNPDAEVLARLQHTRSALGLPDIAAYTIPPVPPAEADREGAEKIIQAVENIHEREVAASEETKRVADAYREAVAFTNLKVSYSELESLSFLTMRVGKIESSAFDDLKAALGSRAIIVQLGEDKSRIMAACSKKARFFVDAELKKAGFVELQIPKDFKGVPDEVLETLKAKKTQTEAMLVEIQTERKNYAETHKEHLFRLLQVFSVGSQVYAVENKLESTEFVYRMTGWIPAYRTRTIMKDLDDITKGRTAIREFLPSEVSSVVNGHEKVPVRLRHGKLVRSFERMIFSYGAPLYGTIDPTPFVALFFTMLFGIMFGDAGQGLVFLLLGVLMALKVFRLGGWEKFALVFISIGVSSTFMGLLTGEFFANEELLAPFSRFVTGLFGEPRHPILHMMPSNDPHSIKRMFMFFGFTVGVGFIINTCGLVINIINQFSLRRLGKALFGKIGLSGAVFFWYVVAFGVRVALFHHHPVALDWVVIFGTLLLSAFGEVLARLIDGERPVLENGLSSAMIGAVVEVIEIISSYLSNTVSFLRVGAFALAHAVLGFIISLMSGMPPMPWGIVVGIVGNAVVIVLEGMIVAIQVVRLQYYEFFSKFFTETGREFKPFAFTYQSAGTGA